MLRKPAHAYVLVTGILACMCLLHPPATGMDPDRAMSQYVHDRWGAEQGFPPGPVYAITQAADGYLWIGAEAGLVRFDGWNFRVIKDDTGAFTIGSVLGLTSDDEGCLWLRLQDLSLVRYCRGVFERPSEQYRGVEAMNRASNGGILVWRAQEGVLRFHGGRPEKIASAADLPPSPVISVAQTSAGDLYMGTRDAGLFLQAGAGKTKTSIRNGLPDLKVNCLLAAGEQDLWIGTDKGIARWNGRELMDAGMPPRFRRFQALAMVRDRDGNLWVGADSIGLLRLSSSGFASLREGDGSPGEAVTALFEDREGNLWIGHADGIERLRDSAFVTYSKPEGLPSDGSNPLFVDGDGRMWFSATSGGLWWLKGNQHGKISNDGLDRDVTYSLAGGGGELWIGRQRGGLTRLVDRAGSMQAHTYRQADGLAHDSVYSVYRTRDGTVWAGTLSAGVSMLKNGRFTNFAVEEGLASNTVASILEGSDGAMWFATPSGLSAWSNGRWQSYRTREGLPSENINCLLEDSAGTLWVGTASGIAFRSGKAFQVPAGVPEPLRSQIFGIAEDRYGALWVATANHVLRVRREKLRQGTLADGDIREYGLADGLRGVEGVKRHRSVVVDKDGRIWFSLNRGISVVDPARLSRNSAPAVVRIETISAGGKPIRTEGEVHIPGGRQRITIGYVGLSLSMPERARYRYLLEGFDSAWSEPVATREAVYTNLAPRPYRLRVIASTPDGVWNSQEAAIDFEVDPLYWQTWWFRLSAIAVSAAAIAAVYRFRLRQATRLISARFQARLAERARIAQDLHDTLLQGFLSASMQVHVAADALPEESPARPTLARAMELMRQVIDEGRDALRGLRSTHSASLDLEHAFSRIQQELSSREQGSRDVDFRVIVEGQQRPLHPVLRDELYRIGREALLNAFRHAHASKIEMELKYSSKRLCILVRDAGCRIDPDVLRSGRDGHWGLSGMRERADRIGARFHVMSSASAGTEIELSVPGKVAFQSEPNGRIRWFAKRSR